MTPAAVPLDLTPDELAACDAMFELLVAERDADGAPHRDAFVVRRPACEAVADDALHAVALTA